VSSRRGLAIGGALVLFVVCVVRVASRHPAGGFAHIVLAEELAAALGTAGLVAFVAFA
jgi:hypothetical protein